MVPPPIGGQKSSDPPEMVCIPFAWKEGVTTAALVGRESKLPGEEWLSCLERVYPGLQSGRSLFQAGER